jgi:hypothetical protein
MICKEFVSRIIAALDPVKHAAIIKQLEDELEAIPAAMAGNYDRATVTDHAVCRYLERTMNLDIKSVKKQILNGHEKSVKKIKEGRLKTSAGYTLVVREGFVTTIL